MDSRAVIILDPVNLNVIKDSLAKGGRDWIGGNCTVSLMLMALGGLAYTGGVVFYLWHRLPYNHAIWHGFVLTAASVHYAAVLTTLVG